MNYNTSETEIQRKTILRGWNERVKLAMGKNNITSNNKLADALDCNKSLVSQHLNGKRMLSLQRIERLTSVLGVDVRFIFSPDELDLIFKGWRE